MENIVTQFSAIDHFFEKKGYKGHAERQPHFAQFLEAGFPNKKQEEYKFTPFDKLLDFSKTGLHTNDGELTKDQIKGLFFAEDGAHLVYVNGQFEPTLSEYKKSTELTIGVDSSIDKLNHIADSKDAFTALNTAFTSAYASLTLAKNKETKPVFVYHIVNAEEVSMINPRLVVSAAPGAKLDIIEKVLVDGDATTFINMVTEIDVAANASLSYTKLQNHDRNVIIHDELKTIQARDSRFYSNTFTFSGKQVRNNIDIKLLDENCETHMHGLYLTDGTTHVDNHTTVDHTVPNCYSNEVYKGIVDGKSTAVFNGKIFVRPNAQQTNAFQSNNNVSLSDLATVHTKPQLEIWADDVKCSHGCTIGQLDEEALFYLRARGLDQRTAKSMLLVAFAEDTFEYITLDCVKEELHQIIQSRLV